MIVDLDARRTRLERLRALDQYRIGRWDAQNGRSDWKRMTWKGDERDAYLLGRKEAHYRSFDRLVCARQITHEIPLDETDSCPTCGSGLRREREL